MRAPFSVFFLAPVLLPQPMDIFLVPIARDASGFTYEAVFT